MQNELSPNLHESRSHAKIRYSLGGQIFGISWTPKIHTCAQNRSFLVPIFNQKKPVHITLLYLTEKYNKISKLMPLYTYIYHSLPG